MSGRGKELERDGHDTRSGFHIKGMEAGEGNERSVQLGSSQWQFLW